MNQLDYFLWASVPAGGPDLPKAFEEHVTGVAPD